MWAKLSLGSGQWLSYFKWSKAKAILHAGIGLLRSLALSLSLFLSLSLSLSLLRTLQTSCAEPFCDANAGRPSDFVSEGILLKAQLVGKVNGSETRKVRASVFLSGFTWRDASHFKANQGPTPQPAKNPSTTAGDSIGFD